MAVRLCVLVRFNPAEVSCIYLYNDKALYAAILFSVVLPFINYSLLYGDFKRTERGMWLSRNV